MSPNHPHESKACPRCGGPAIYWRDAIVPGDPAAPRGSRRAAAHAQPALVCVACGHLQPVERRGVRTPARQGA